ncbi:hypothetical protein Tco_0015588 [Tanacetum coccineum]
MEKVSHMDVKFMWGNSNYDYVFSEAAGSEELPLFLSLRDIDKRLDQYGPIDSFDFRRQDLMINLNDLNEMKKYGFRQKAKVRWAIEGDRTRNPILVKKAFKDHYEARFNKPTKARLKLNFSFPNRLSTDQVADLERHVSHDEIRLAVWDCGVNKSPVGPRPGFTLNSLEILEVIGPDFCEAVEHFFKQSRSLSVVTRSFIDSFQNPRCKNSSTIIALISLIGCIIRSSLILLASRLAMVIAALCLTPSALLLKTDLGCPFILNEGFIGVKGRKERRCFIKFDIAKAYDSIEDNASSLGCSIWKTSSVILGLMVCGLGMTRHKAWDDVILKLQSRLSKWKAKTLSIGGRLTLLKSVLGASPLYNMSIFKVPKGVLKVFGVNSSNFFESGVSSYFALNRALPLKVGFGVSFRQDDSCGFVVSKAVHGDKLIPHSFRIIRGGVEQQEFSDLSSFLNSVVLSTSNDRWYFSLSSSGEFSVKDTRLAIDDLVLPSHSEPTRWVKLIPIKIQSGPKRRFCIVFAVGGRSVFSSFGDAFLQIGRVFSSILLPGFQ